VHTTHPPLLLLGTGARQAREFVLQQIAATHPVVLADDELASWARPYVQHHLAVDLTDGDSTAATVKAYAADHDVAGVATYMEHHVITAAQLAQDLALPGNPPEAMVACRDKAQTRRLLAEHAVPSARSLQAGDAEEAVAHAELLGYPVVVKPRAMAGSAGVVRADNAHEVRAAYPRACLETVLGLDRFAVPGVLVEEYLDGPEISAETVVLRPGGTRIVAVTRKTLGPLPTFQEFGHCVDANDELISDPRLAEVVAATVDALGITLGVLHIELRLTSRGPAVIEVNARLGGDHIPQLVHMATRLNLPRAVADLATGQEPDLAATTRRAAAIGFAYPPTNGVIEQLGMPADIVRQPGIEHFRWTKQVGNRVAAPPHASITDRMAHWIVTGADAAECTTRLEGVERHLSAHIADPVHSTSCTN